MNVACQSVESENPISIRQLIEMTEAQDSVISQFKPKALASDGNMDTHAKKALLGMVFYYERIVWITNKIAHALASDQEGEEYVFTPNGDVEMKESKIELPLTTTQT